LQDFECTGAITEHNGVVIIHQRMAPVHVRRQPGLFGRRREQQTFQRERFMINAG
jgi:hypothetical protein